jgi:hypothetical protein
MDKNGKQLQEPISKEKILCYPSDLEGVMKIVVRYYVDKIVEADTMHSFEDIIKEIRSLGTKLYEPFSTISEDMCSNCDKILKKFNNDLELLNTAISETKEITKKEQIKVKPKIVKKVDTTKIVDEVASDYFTDANDIVSSDW